MCAVSANACNGQQDIEEQQFGQRGDVPLKASRLFMLPARKARDEQFFRQQDSGRSVQRRAVCADVCGLSLIHL